LFRSLLRIRAVDRVEVSVVPILLGTGVQLLPDLSERIPLKLVEQRTYRSGRISLQYDIQK
jgi:dihydrofolate reductase